MKTFRLFTISLFLTFFVGFTTLVKAQYTVYAESFGTISTNTNIDEHTDYDVSTVTYSASSTAVNLRLTNGSAGSDGTVPAYLTASGGANVFINKADEYLQISGINTNGYKDLTLNFGYRKGANAGLLSHLLIQYSTNGEDWTEIVPTYWTRNNPITAEGVPADFPTTTSTGWYYITCDASANTIPTTSNLSLRFTNLYTVSNEVRLDDILLVGDYAPTVTITSPEDGAVLSPCDSVSIGINFDNFTLYSAYPIPGGDGFLKIESEIIPLLGMPGLESPIYCDQFIFMALNSFGALTLPEGEYSLTVSLVGLDSLPLTPPATQTIHVSVVREVVEDPEFSVPAGTYNTAQTVEITTTTEDAVIYYTIDGTDPDENSLVYSDPIDVEESMTITAIAYKECATPSQIVSAEYIIDTTTPPVGIATLTPGAIQIYPNPVTNVLTVTANGFTEIEIINLLGQTVYQNSLNKTRQINIANLNAGIYFVRLKGETIMTKKIIKK